MKNVLYMHSGSGNHGCEAIVRTTAVLLGGPDNAVLWSLAPQEDHLYGASQSFSYVVASEELRRFSLEYFEAFARRRFFKQPDANMNVFLREQFKGNVAISVGGDNYCYPWSAQQAVTLNRIIRKHCTASVLWACSIDPEAITPAVREDLASYDLITARESITYDLLKGINPNTVQVSDPAFALERVDRPLPEGFAEGNTVGINVSPLIMKYGTEEDLILKNYENVIRYILNQTEMNVCLIPHVIWDRNDDRVPLEKLRRRFQASDRVCVVADASCCVLKGYIARCRFFIGARTHATIAAYSSNVPTLVTGYSVKARGIAQDLFGTDENFVLPVQTLKEENDLLCAFTFLLRNEEAVRQALERKMPEYIENSKNGLGILHHLTTASL